MDDKPLPGLTARAQAEQQARREREAQALRDNLHRRKEQARAREAQPKPDLPKPALPKPDLQDEPGVG